MGECGYKLLKLCVFIKFCPPEKREVGGVMYAPAELGKSTHTDGRAFIRPTTGLWSSSLQWYKPRLGLPIPCRNHEISKGVCGPPDSGLTGPLAPQSCYLSSLVGNIWIPPGNWVSLWMSLPEGKKKNLDAPYALWCTTVSDPIGSFFLRITFAVQKDWHMHSRMISALYITLIPGAI